MKKRVIRLWKNEFFQGGFFLTISSIVANILNYFFNFLTARSLGPKNYGEIYTFFSYISIFSVFITASSTFIIQKISSFEQNRYHLAWSLESWFFGKMKKYWYLLIPVFIINFFMPKITNLSFITASFILPMIILSFISSFYSASLQGLKLFFWFALITLIGVSFKLLGAIMVTIGIDGVLTILFFLLVSWISGFLISRHVIHKNIKNNTDKPTFQLNHQITYIFKNHQFIITLLSVLAMALFSNFDMVFVKKFFPADIAGIYSSWTLFAKVILYAVGPVLSVTFVFFADDKNSQKQNQTLLITIFIVLIAALTAYLFYKFLGFQIIEIFFGDRFLPLIPYLEYSAIFGFFYAVVAFINNYFLAKKSIYALILVFLIPVYFILLFLAQKELMDIIKINIGFSAITALIYFIAYLKNIFKLEKQKNV